MSLWVDSRLLMHSMGEFIDATLPNSEVSERMQIEDDIVAHLEVVSDAMPLKGSVVVFMLKSFVIDSSISLSISLLPHRIIKGMFELFSIILDTTFPSIVCWSNMPSPVIIKSLFFILSSK